MSLNPLATDDPARVGDFGSMPGEAQWNSKQLNTYERRIEQLEDQFFTVACADIMRCIRGESEGVLLLMCGGLLSASRSDLLAILNEQTTVDEGLSLWVSQYEQIGNGPEQTKKRIIDGLAWDVAKARAEIEAHLA